MEMVTTRGESAPRHPVGVQGRAAKLIGPNPGPHDSDGNGESGARATVQAPKEGYMKSRRGQRWQCNAGPTPYALTDGSMCRPGKVHVLEKEMDWPYVGVTFCHMSINPASDARAAGAEVTCATCAERCAQTPDKPTETG